jgi:hypothetical protein
MAADEIIVSVPRQTALTLPPKQRCPCPVSTASVLSMQAVHALVVLAYGLQLCIALALLWALLQRSVHQYIMPTKCKQLRQGLKPAQTHSRSPHLHPDPTTPRSSSLPHTQEFVSPAYWDASPWFVKLGVRLLCEQRKGAASPLAQWIQQLPQQVC